MRISANLRVAAVMNAHVHRCAAHECARDVLHAMLQTKAPHALVLAFDGSVIGTVALSTLLSADRDAPITRFMRHTVLWISEHESVAIAVRVMALSTADFLVVHDDRDRIVGGLGSQDLIGLGMGLDTVELAG